MLGQTTYVLTRLRNYAYICILRVVTMIESRYMALSMLTANMSANVPTNSCIALASLSCSNWVHTQHYLQENSLP